MANIMADYASYLNAEAIGNDTLSGPIEKVVVEEIGGERKHVLFIGGHPKGLPLNRTNAKALAAVLGPETDDWTGAPVEIFTADTTFMSKPCRGVRVRIMKSKS